MTNLISLDPGKTTGWSSWHYNAVTPLHHLDHGQISGGLEGFIQWWNEGGWAYWADEVVSETFVLDGRTLIPDTTPLRIEGALSVLFPSWVGQRNTAKAHADDLLLKRHDLWFVGQPHATDSARHAIAHLKTRRHAPTLRRFWPPKSATS